MTDAERLAAILAAGITDEQLASLAAGRIVLWKSEGVRRDEREACAKIADAHVTQHEDRNYPTGIKPAVQLEGRSIADAIRNRSTS